MMVEFALMVKVRASTKSPVFEALILSRNHWPALAVRP